MNLKKNIKIKSIWNKAGSYITEAAMSLPILILCIIALALVIKIIAICENIGFVTAAEVKDIDIAAYHVENTYLTAKTAIENSVTDENPKLSKFSVKKFKYRYTAGGIDDLIAVHTQADFKVENPIGILGEITFTQKLLTRGFTGTLQDGEPLSAEAFMSAEPSVEVVIFPKYGKKYHAESCRYVTQNYTGDTYKLKMQKSDAEAKGYTACSVCKGG